MNELEFEFDSSKYRILSPYTDESPAELFESNLNETFSSGASTPMCLPPGLVYVGDRQSLIIFERPPRFQKISFNQYKRDKAINYSSSNKEYVIPLPWQIYVGEFGTNGLLNALHIYFASSEIIGLSVGELLPGASVALEFKDKGSLMCCPLPNVYETNLVCLDKETGYAENPNLASKMNLMYSSMWDTSFNADILYQIESQISYFSVIKGGLARKVRRVEDWLGYWSSQMPQQILDGFDPDTPFFTKANLALPNQFRLSEWFIAPSPYKFINTLQQLI